ncbi:MAG: enoyl-CoA hydratase/isomerase family protein [Rhodospirillales bacterium]|jgi:enoyl-CoA hydratase/carnithine racemase|nr:enoyl-CoA hydratase/isomerase family protein [Rhodospirillales bacterium]
MDETAYQSLRLSIADQIATVTLDRPPVNAQTRATQDEIALCFDRLSDMPEVRAVILTGAGRVFSAGADIKARVGAAPSLGGDRQHLRSARESYHAIMECRKPVIAAINGPALGAGLALVASCDILVAAEEAELGLPEVTVGLMGGCRHAMRLFGHSTVRRMMFTGERLRGPELYRRGVVEECVPQAGLMAAAAAIAARIAGLSPTAVQLAKHSINTIETMSLRDGYRFEQDMTMQLSKTPDAIEAKRAFLEKRKPVFGDG